MVAGTTQECAAPYLQVSWQRNDYIHHSEERNGTPTILSCTSTKKVGVLFLYRVKFSVCGGQIKCCGRMLHTLIGVL